MRAWTTAQNDRTRTALDAVPARGRFRARLAELTQAGTAESPSVRGDLLFTIDRWGDRDRAALVVRSIADPGAGAGRVLLDPADASGEVTSAIDWYQPSPDGTLVAFGTSTGGDERSTLRILDVATGALLPDALPHTRAASVAWLPDSSGFAYTRYPDPAEVGDAEAGYHRTVWWHRLGDAPADDAPCFTDLPDKEAWPEVSLSVDGRWLLVHVERGWSQNDVHLLDRDADTWTTRDRGRQGSLDLAAGGRGATAPDRRDDARRSDGPAGRRAVRPAPVGALGRPRRARATTSSRRSQSPATDLLVLRTRAGVSFLQHHDAVGDHLGSVDDVTGGLSAVTALASHPSAPGLVAVGHTSFARPDTVTAWRPGAAPRELTRLPGPSIAPATVSQVRYPSTDGVSCPMLLVHETTTEIDPRHAHAPHGVRRLQHHRDPGLEPVPRHVVRARRSGGHPWPPRRR